MKHNLLNRQFERLTVIGESEPQKGKSAWMCRCKCGREKTVLATNLLRGKIRSCGCLAVEQGRRIGLLATKHGHYKTGTYHSYRAMLSRCYDPRNLAYPKYGAKGITVCQRWMDSFDNFLADMGERPEGTTLDRFPKTKWNYEPSNCRWATIEEQNRNRGDFNIFIEFQGRSLHIIEWSKETGLPINTLRKRLRNKWSIDRMLTTPKREYPN